MTNEAAKKIGIRAEGWELIPTHITRTQLVDALNLLLGNDLGGQIVGIEFDSFQSVTVSFVPFDENGNPQVGGLPGARPDNITIIKAVIPIITESTP